VLPASAVGSSKISVDARSTQRHIPEDDILHSHRCENLKSYILSDCLPFSRVNSEIRDLLRRPPASHSGGPVSNPGLVMWDFMMDKSGAGGKFSPRTLVSPANRHSICFSTITRGWHNRPGVAAVPIASQAK
jgi:hypothetical protein